MLTKNHENLTIEVKRHVGADAVRQGKYWDGSHGCFIGCLAHSDDATKLGEMYGLPLLLVRICEDIFESLPAAEAEAFFAALPDAVGRDGKDLTRAHWAFLASELRCFPKADDDDTQRAIDIVIEGMELLASGGEWSRDSSRAAADAAADAAAYTTAYTAADAAADAAYTAYVAYTGEAVPAATRATAHAARTARTADRATVHAARTAARMRQRDTILRVIAES